MFTKLFSKSGSTDKASVACVLQMVLVVLAMMSVAGCIETRFAEAKKAVIHGDLPKLIAVLEEIDVNQRMPSRNPFENNSTLLIIASKKISPNMVDALLEHGADPTIQSECGDTALHAAIKFGLGSDAGTRVANRIAEHPSVLDIGDADGWTALHLCVIHGLYDQAEVLISRGADVNKRDNEGHTPLAILKLKDKEDVQLFKLLVNSGAIE